MDIAKANNIFWIVNKALIFWGYIYELIAIFRIEKWTKVNKLNHYIKWSDTVFFANATKLYEGWNFNIGNYLFTTDTK